MTTATEETAYLIFKKMKGEGHTGTELVHYFGSNTAARLAMRYQAEQAAERVAPHSYREPIDMVCAICHRKHCRGHAQEQGVGR